MKKIASILTFIFLLIIIVELRLHYVNDNVPNSSFVFMLLITVISSLYLGIWGGLLMLFVTAGIIGYAFFTPQDLTQLTLVEMRQIGFYILEGIFILFLVYFLRRTKEQEHELRERFQIILASIGDAVIATDEEGNIKYMNARAQRLTEWNFREAQKQTIFHILQFEDKAFLKTFVENVQLVIKEGKSLMINKFMTIKNKRGRTLDIQDTIAPLRNMSGDIIGTVIIFKDVSQHKEMEEQKEVLLGAISHELKNYITSIQGYSYIIQKKVKVTRDEQLISFSEKLNNKIDSMKTMVVSMLDLSKLNMGKLDMNIEEIDMEELILSTINDLEINTKHIIKMKGSIDSHVLGDKIRIGQVLTNLITNAIKYSPEDKEIQVSIKRNETEAIIGVKDFGKGVPQEKIDKIFKPFYRAVNQQDKMTITGSGLGLYVSREIMKQNNGDIWVKSEEGVGSTFYFSLPVIASNEYESEYAKNDGMLGKIKKLLQLRFIRK